MTVQEALAAGYKEADRTFQRGYLSRKTDVFKQEVKSAGGSRQGQIYYLAPCWKTTNYCYRVYLTK